MTVVIEPQQLPLTSCCILVTVKPQLQKYYLRLFLVYNDYVINRAKLYYSKSYRIPDKPLNSGWCMPHPYSFLYFVTAEKNI